jgi:hypothetical protein
MPHLIHAGNRHQNTATSGTDFRRSQIMRGEFKVSRRELLLSLPALAVARQVLAQSGTKFKVRALNHFTIAVPDPKRTIDFYQTLFGMPVQAHQGPNTTVLRIGPGPQFMAVGKVADGATPSITHYCLTS